MSNLLFSIIKDEFIVHKLFLTVGSRAGYEWAYYVVKLSARFITSYPDSAPLEMRRSIDNLN